MSRKCRLLARAQIDGEVREVGYVFTLPDSARGPHKTTRFSQVDADWSRGWVEFLDGSRDEPLFEVIEVQHSVKA